MRAFVAFSLLTFCFLLCLGILGEELKAYSPASAAEAGRWAKEVESTVTSPIEPSPLTVIGDLWRSLAIFVKTVAYATVLAPALFIDLGLPANIVALLSSIVYFIYGVTVIEFLRGKDVF